MKKETILTDIMLVALAVIMGGLAVWAITNTAFAIMTCIIVAIETIVGIMTLNHCIESWS